MKKIITLTALLLAMTLGSQAQNRKTWDFTKGFSSTTIQNLKADGWTDEVADQSIQCPDRTAGPVTAKVSGVDWIVPETSGLTFYETSAKHLIFGYNRSGYAGTKFLWLNGGKTQDAMTIPAIPAGEKVTIDYESHKNTEARGFKVSSGSFADASGATQFKTKGRDTVVLINNGAAEADLKIQATNGMHIYSIVIGEGDPVETKQIAYVYNSAATGYSADADVVLAQLKALENTTVNLLDVATATLDVTTLEGYAAVIISSTVPADNAAVAVLKEAMPWTPMLNLNASLYAAWGYGEAVASSSNFAKLKDVSNSIFSSAEKVIDGGTTAVAITTTNPYMTVKPGAYFDGDDTLAVDMVDTTAVAIHAHNINHNGYMYLPYSYEAATEAYTNSLPIIGNAVSTLESSKSEITQLSAPTIKLTYKNLNTDVTIKSSNKKAVIYYTTDGTTPTTASTVYTGTFNLTQESIVKAVAIANGYLLSDVTEQNVVMMEQPKTPTITLDIQDGKTTATLACETPNVVIWYNMTNSTDTLASSKYKDPISFTASDTITAFAVVAKAVWSGPVTTFVPIKNAVVRIDPVAHFQAPQWTGISNGGTPYNWTAKSGRTIYDQSATPTQVTDPTTGEVTLVYPERADSVILENATPAEWQAMTKGQSIIWQSTTVFNTNIGDDSNYHPSATTDVDANLPISKYDYQFYNVNGKERPTAKIQSIKKYQAPFDVVTLANMQSGRLVIEVSADSTNWTVVGDTINATGYSRLWTKFVRSYEGTDQVYVRLAQVQGAAGPKIFDIYVAVTGEKSAVEKARMDKEYTDWTTGIANVQNTRTAKITAIYSLNGTRMNALTRGINIVRYADGTTKKIVK